MNQRDPKRRTVLKTIGAGVTTSAALTGVASADHQSNGKPNHLDPLWGYSDVVEAERTEEGVEVDFPSPKDFPPPVRPDHTVELHLEEPLGFHFHPAGLHVKPGDIVMFQLHSPDHTVTAYHPQFRGGQRVPDGVGPFSSPVLPAGGYWLYQFEEGGVYDLMCAPHEFMGMVMRIVADDGEGDAPDGYEEDVGGPSPFHLYNHLEELGLLPPDQSPPPFTFPSSLEALSSEALYPETIIQEEAVGYSEVFAEFNPDMTDQ